MTELRLDSVSKRYVRGRAWRQALSEVSLEIHGGDFAAILGMPRAGKSTLLRVAAAIEAPDSGTVSYCGRPLHAMSERELADYRLRAVAWVSGSRPPLPGYRVGDYLALPALAPGGERRAARDRAHEALDAVGASHCGSAELQELSEGERQRVEIAAALVRRPRMVVADEPVAGLGMVETRAILAILRNLAEHDGMGVLITASDSSELLGATRIAGLLTGGRLIKPRPGEDESGEVVAFPPRAGSPDVGA